MVVLVMEHERDKGRRGWRAGEHGKGALWGHHGDVHGWVGVSGWWGGRVFGVGLIFVGEWREDKVDQIFGVGVNVDDGHDKGVLGGVEIVKVEWDVGILEDLVVFGARRGELVAACLVADGPAVADGGEVFAADDARTELEGLVGVGGRDAFQELGEVKVVDGDAAPFGFADFLHAVDVVGGALGGGFGGRRFESFGFLHSDDRQTGWLQVLR